jgi:ATP-binding cassette subfamily B protein
VAAAGTADREVDRILEPLPELHAHGRRTWTALASAAARTALLAPLLQLAILAVAGLLLSAGRLSPGGLFAAVQYAALGAGLGAVVATLNRLIRTRTGARRLAEVIGEPVTEFGTRELPPGPGTLRFNSVTVNAGPESAGPLTAGPLLDRIDLTVPAGQTVAVVGRSGAGKSVLATVAGRLRDPDGGEVTLDGVPLADLAPDALASAVGYGFERPVLVGNTIADALALGHPGTDPDIPDPDVRQAARIAAIDGYVRRLPDGYRTRLAEAPMSGGEAQRLGLARALHGRRLLVLDDASSSVDSVTEAELGRAMREQLAGRTRLVVTHRVATAARADLVAWLAAGRLRGFAPHHVLWTDPAYRAVFATGDPDEPN